MGDSVCTICQELDDEYILGRRVMKRGTKRRAQYAKIRRIGFTYQGEKESICRRRKLFKSPKTFVSVPHNLHKPVLKHSRTYLEPIITFLERGYINRTFD
jgi:hypothetical protein